MNTTLNNVEQSLEEVLISTFDFNMALIVPDAPGEYLIHASYDYLTFKVVKGYEGEKFSAIVSKFKNGIAYNNWHDSYTLTGHSLAIIKLLDIYKVSYSGYYVLNNKLYYMSPEEICPKEVVNLDDLKQYTVTLDKDLNFAGLHILCSEHFYIINKDGWTRRPAYQAI